MQREAIERARAESCTDPRVPLAMPAPFPRPDFGPSVADYFARKHATGARGTFFPLHLSFAPRSRWGGLSDL